MYTLQPPARVCLRSKHCRLHTQGTTGGAGTQTITLTNGTVWEILYDPIPPTIPAGVDPTQAPIIQITTLSNGTVIQQLPLVNGTVITVLTDPLEPIIPPGLPANSIARVGLRVLGNGTGWQQVQLVNGSVVRSVIVPVVPPVEGQGVLVF